jgi:predicted dinucleotide-binding enzyme
MKIAVIGSGNVGSALANGWQKAGYSVSCGVRSLSSPKSEKARALNPYITIKNIPEAVEQADVVVVCTPSDIIPNLVKTWGQMDDKVLIDTTNSFRARPEPFVNGFVALKELTHAEHVVKCFNCTGYENMIDPYFGDEPADMFVAGDSEKAKKVAEELAIALGFGNCYDLGGDDKVALLEQMALIWVNLSQIHSHGRQHAFKVLNR